MTRGTVLVALAVFFSYGSAGAQSADEAAGAAAAEVAKPVPKAKPKIVQILVPAFTEIGPKAAGWGAKAADAWAAKLAEATKVKVLGPSKLSSVLSEAQIATLTGDGRGDAARAAGAQAVLTGEVSDQVDRLVVNCRLVSVVTGAVWVASKQPFDPSAKAEAKVEASAEPKPAPKVEPKGADAKVEAKKEEPKWDTSAPNAGGVESGSVEVVVRKLADRIAEGFAKLPGKARYRRLAVIPFSDVGAGAKSHQVGAIVTAEIATVLRRDHGLILVERAQLSQVMSELRLQAMTQDTSSEQAGEVGKLSDAQALVLGSVNDAGDKYLIHAKVVSAANGEALVQESTSLPAAGLVSMASESVVLRSKSGAVFRSLVVPGWGQIYNRQKLKAGLFLGGELALFGGALALHFSGDWALNRYHENKPETAGHWKLAEDRYGWRNILLYAAAAVWVANILDAYLSGVDGDSALSGAMGESKPRFVPVVGAGKDGAMVGGVLTF